VADGTAATPPVSAIGRQEPSPPKRQPRAWISLVAAALWAAGGHGWHWWLFAAPALPLLLTPAVALMAKIHAQRVHQLHAAGGAVSLLLALLCASTGGGFNALLAGFASVFVFLSAGRVALRSEPRYDGAVAPQETAALDAKAALDETLLAYFVGVADIPAGPEAEARSIEATRMVAALHEHGWANQPERFHQLPPPPLAVAVDAARHRGIHFERIRYDSGFVPRPELPGARAWMQLPNNRQSVLRVFRHAGAPRPWLMCIHGYRMGHDWIDFGLFPPAVLHKKMGFNLLLPTLPLHGPRKVGSSSGDGFLDGNLLTLIHSQTQAVWDLRRALAWLRDREPDARVGVYGVSLGGYNAALLAGYEAELDFVLAGVPLTDVAGVLWRHLPQLHRHFYAQHGLTEASYRAMAGVVSPLTRPALPATERLHIFAAAADRIVPPDQPLLLARHWQRPVQWYQGSHLSIRHEALARRALRVAMAGAGWR
jgi:Prolyl oligopeptidase family